jgi:hypothetical protein
MLHAVRPPWVARGQLDAYYTLHPEERTFKASMVFKDFVGRSPKGEGAGG